MIVVLLKLILAHILGDFFLQWSGIVKQKNQKKWGAPLLYIHGIIHFLLLILLVGLKYWVAATIITMLHIIIDGIKVSAQNNHNKQRMFFIDQALHLLVILTVWLFLFKENLYEIPFLLNRYTLTIIIAYLFLTRPAGFIISQALSHWTQEISYEGEIEKSLPKAGWYIGMLERILVLTFVLIGQWGAIGFLMAAKSIFRFGDLTRAKDRKLTEYIVIGTFLSFGMAILAGIIAGFQFY